MGMAIKKFISKKQNEGYTILFTMLIGGLILAMTLSMVNFTINEFSFVRDTRQGNRVFISMNSMLECILYYDRHQGSFPFQGVYGTVECGDQTVINDGYDPGDGSFRYDVEITPPNFGGNSACVKVSVTKGTEVGRDTNNDPILGTSVLGTGYSTDCSMLASSNLSNITSRSLEYTYPD